MFSNGWSLGLLESEPTKRPLGSGGGAPWGRAPSLLLKILNMLQASGSPGQKGRARGCQQSSNIPEPRLTPVPSQEGASWGFSTLPAQQDHPESFWKRDAQDQLNQNRYKMESRHPTLFFKTSWRFQYTVSLEPWPVALWCSSVSYVFSVQSAILLQHLHHPGAGEKCRILGLPTPTEGKAAFNKILKWFLCTLRLEKPSTTPFYSVILYFEFFLRLSENKGCYLKYGCLS